MTRSMNSIGRSNDRCERRYAIQRGIADFLARIFTRAGVGLIN